MMCLSLLRGSGESDYDVHRGGFRVFNVPSALHRRHRDSLFLPNFQQENPHFQPLRLHHSLTHRR